MASPRKRLLIVQPSLQPPGGGNSVAAFMIQAVRDEYEITVLTWVGVDLEQLNRYYGTDLRETDFRRVSFNRVITLVLDVVPLPLHHLKRALLARTAFRIGREFDALITANNEMDLGPRAIQYVHFPARFLPRPPVDIRWYHRLPGLLDGYHALVDSISCATVPGVRANLTLANSGWTAERYRHVYGDDSDVRVLPPPVLGRRSSVAWEERSDDFICIGRISPEKRVHRIVAILEAVRKQGWNGVLHLVGHPDNRRYWRRIRDLVRTKSWIRIHFDIPREELLSLLDRSRYGIHGMLDEHFGISVAEMAMAGCVVFVPNGGGQVEIVESDPRVVYVSDDDAVEKIRRVLRDPRLQREISATLCERGSRYTVENFMESARTIVREFVEETPGFSEH